jgi:hypothetical protein
MKRVFLALLLVLLANPALAAATLYSSSSTGSVGVGTNAPTAGAALDLSYNTNSMLLPVGTTGEEPTGVNGMIRFNSDTPGVEVYYSSAWRTLGATTTTSGVASVQTFTSSGTWTMPSGIGSNSVTHIQCWGGGGAGASGGGNAGGGGGGYRDVWVETSTLASSVSVTVGAGGTSGGSGANSTFGSALTAVGGGGPGTTNNPGAGGDNFAGLYFGGANGQGGTTAAQSSIYGGGGGAKFSGTSGTSVFGGNGGGSTVSGSQPGGGGGDAASGGAGECIATTWY